MGVFYHPCSSHDENFAFPSQFHIILKINGCWPTDGDANSFRYRLQDRLYTCWFWFAVLSTMYVLHTELLFLIVNITDVIKVVENLCTVILGIMVVVRMLHVRYAMQRLKSVLRIFADKIWIKEDSHPLIFERCIRRTKPIYYISISLWTVLAIYSVVPIVLFATDKPIDSTDNYFLHAVIFRCDLRKFRNFVLVYVLLTYVGGVTVCQLYAMDALLAIFISFLCGQFEILHGDIMRLIPECHAKWLRSHDVHVRNIDRLQDIYAKRLRELAKQHDDLISFSLDLQKFVSFPLMANIVTSTLELCITFFQFLISGTNSLTDFLRFFLLFLSVSGQFYVVCNLGSMLINRSLETALHLFNCNWEGGQISKNSPLLLQSNAMELETLSRVLPTWRDIDYYPTNNDFQHKLRFMIMRSQRPVQLTALKFVTLSLGSFNRILSSSMSVFALLNSFLDKQI